MTATGRPNPTRQIRRRKLEQLRESIESWERHGREAGRDGDLELAAGYAQDEPISARSSDSSKPEHSTRWPRRLIAWTR